MGNGQEGLRDLTLLPVVEMGRKTGREGDGIAGYRVKTKNRREKIEK